MINDCEIEKGRSQGRRTFYSSNSVNLSSLDTLAGKSPLLQESVLFHKKVLLGKEKLLP